MAKLARFYSTADLTPEQFERVLSRAASGKQANWHGDAASLARKVIGLIFLNPSLRTRASFQSGIARLGGHSIVLTPGSDMWSLELEPRAIMNGNKTEHIKDAGPVLSSYCDALCLRCFPAMHSWQDDRRDATWHAFSECVDIPLLSMETAMWHPCQALADALTLREVFCKELKSKTLSVSWAPHPKQLPMAVPNSTLLMAAQLGMNVRLVCPQGYELDSGVLNQTRQYCELNGQRFDIHHDQREGLSGSDVVYVKSWTPPQYIGRGDEEMRRRKELLGWSFTAEIHHLSRSAWVMHCLPVRRNVEVSDQVLDCSKSLILKQAANRLHAQNSLLLEMCGE